MTFGSIFDTTGDMTVQTAAICTVVSLALGLVIALIHMVSGSHSKSFVATLVVLPALVQAVIMMVNGNLGAGVAIVGAFSLVRFRSVPGTSKEIASIFFAMAIGLATGMGYVVFATALCIVISVVMLVLHFVNFGDVKKVDKVLKITIPENLDYTEVFDEIFEKYTNKAELEKVKTTNLGSMYELQYYIALKDATKEKEMIDAIRCRNGNLTVICAKAHTGSEEL